jgi:hypothetical protein
MFNYRLAVIKTSNRVPQEDRLLCSAFGLCSKSGDVVETIQKTNFHNVPFDKETLIQELGDVCWYLELACLSLNIQLSEKIDVLSDTFSDNILLKLSLKLSKRASWCADHISDYTLDRKPFHEKEMEKRLSEIYSCLKHFADHLNVDLEYIQLRNIQRLKMNYPEGFDI